MEVTFLGVEFTDPLIKSDGIKSGQKITLLKPRMRFITEYFIPDEIYNDWAKDRFEQGHKVQCEKKANGFRTCILKNKNDVSIVFEDAKLERKQAFSMITEILKEIPDDFTLDGELVLYSNNKPVSRINMMKLLGKSPKLEENETAKVFLFDILYWNKDVHSYSLEKRRALLEEFFEKYLAGKIEKLIKPREKDRNLIIPGDATSANEPTISQSEKDKTKREFRYMPNQDRSLQADDITFAKKESNFELAEKRVASNKDELFKALEYFVKAPGSEGCMIKDLTSSYSLDGATSEWTKLKSILTVKVLVLGKKETETPGTWNYTCGLLL